MATAFVPRGVAGVPSGKVTGLQLSARKTPKPEAPAVTGFAPPASPAQGAPAKELVFADDLSLTEIDAHRQAALASISAARGHFPGLVQLQEGERTGSLGKMIALLGPALGHLFAALTPAPTDDAATVATKKQLATVFDTLLGDKDQGKDPGVFEVELLVRRVTRIEAEQEIVAHLEATTKAFADDILNTGVMVVDPGLKAIEVARTIANTKPEFKSLLAPVTNALGEMTKAARAAQAKARAPKDAPPPASPKP
jgi:hypothetical protein